MDRKFIEALEACPYIQGKQKIKVRDWLGNYMEEIPSGPTSSNTTLLKEDVTEDYKYVTKKEFKFEINRIWNTLREG